MRKKPHPAKISPAGAGDGQLPDLSRLTGRRQEGFFTGYLGVLEPHLGCRRAVVRPFTGNPERSAGTPGRRERGLKQNLSKDRSGSDRI